MKKVYFLLSFALLLALSSCNPQEKHQYIEITTDHGLMKVKLFNSTPKHRDNMIKLASEGYYDGLLFHRVISGFMVQGGDPDSRTANPGQALGGGGPGYLVDAELGAPHLKGAIAAARTQNPEKASSGCQFYIVQGQKQTDEQLDVFEQQKKIKYSPEQRKLYKEIGGTPQLDMDYTVYGEVVDGLDVIDKLAAVKTAPGDRPLQDVKMTIKVLEPQ
jgi:cyclophilin family peptidyl-prolyl cis-trans isomerase